MLQLVLLCFQTSVGGSGEEGRKSDPSLHDSDPGRMDQLIYGQLSVLNKTRKYITYTLPCTLCVWVGVCQIRKFIINSFN